MLDSGGALAQFERIVQMQGTRELPPIAPYRQIIPATEDGRIREIDCWEIARVAKRAGAPANLSAGVLLFKGVGDIVAKGEPLLELHAESATQLEFARSYADSHPEIVRFGF